MHINFEEFDNNIRKYIYDWFSQYKKICGKEVSEQINLNLQKESYKDYEGDTFTKLTSMIPDMFADEPEEVFNLVGNMRLIKYSYKNGAALPSLTHIVNVISLRNAGEKIDISNIENETQLDIYKYVSELDDDGFINL